MKTASVIQRPMSSLVKWAGGKGFVLDRYAHVLPAPADVTTYHEPFLGSAAVARHYLGKTRCVLSDLNARLMAMYRAVRAFPFEVSRVAHGLAELHSAEHYYAVRAAFNRDAFDGSEGVTQAARFLYLNRACYNGLYRENKSGGFNVPVGSYKTIAIPSQADIEAWSVLLNRNCLLHAEPFDAHLERIRRGAFVFYDPPYVPVSKTANFTEYQAGGFGPKDQERLAEILVEVNMHGARFLLTNAAEAAPLYKRWHTMIAEVPRSINSKGTGRGTVKEILVANYPLKRKPR